MSTKIHLLLPGGEKTMCGRPKTPNLYAVDAVKWKGIETTDPHRMKDRCAWCITTEASEARGRGGAS